MSHGKQTFPVSQASSSFFKYQRLSPAVRRGLLVCAVASGLCSIAFMTVATASKGNWFELRNWSSVSTVFLAGACLGTVAFAAGVTFAKPLCLFMHKRQWTNWYQYALGGAAAGWFTGKLGFLFVFLPFFAWGLSLPKQLHDLPQFLFKLLLFFIDVTSLPGNICALVGITIGVLSAIAMWRTENIF